MKFYYYSIKNKINFNQYIGITQYPLERRRKHYNLLKKNLHPNPHLQLAFNKYGEDNFIFSIIEEKEFKTKKDGYDYEAKLIKKYDSFNNGYNCNPGGFWSGPTGKFNEQQVYYILSALYFNKKITGVLAKLFNVSPATIENIRIGRNYKGYCDNFNLLEEIEKHIIYEEFCSISNFELLKETSYSKQSKRKFTKEQAFLIFRWHEHKFTTAKKLCEYFNIPLTGKVNEKPSNKFRTLKEGCYKDWLAEYKILTEEEKQKIERQYTEKCIETII